MKLVLDNNKKTYSERHAELVSVSLELSSALFPILKRELFSKKLTACT